MLKNLLKELTEFFEMPESGDLNSEQLLSEYDNLFNEIKGRILKFKGVKGLALFSSSGSLLFKEVLEKEKLNFENLNSLIVDIHKLSNEYAINSTLSCILLRDLNFFIKELSLNGKSYYLVIVSDKSQPLGTLISFLNKLEVDDVNDK